MNSIEAANKMLQRVDNQISLLRKQELDVSREIQRLTEEIDIYRKMFEETHDQKYQLIVTKHALMNYIAEGGGLDMIN